MSGGDAPGLAGEPSLRRADVVALFGNVQAPETARAAGERLFGLQRGAERPLPAGARLGPYRVEALLGVGGQGFVYEARHEELGRSVALKVPRREVAESIVREARVAARVEHEAIVRVEDVRTDGERPFLVMERMKGGSLADREGPRSLAEVRAVGHALLDALACIHTRGVVHRDLKPSNVLFDERGRAKLADLGIGAVVEADPAEGSGQGLGTLLTEETRALVPRGTPLYAAPEQVRPGGDLDGRADLFAFGKVLYGMVTGEPPATVRPPSRVRDGLDARWDDFIFRLLETDREDRFPSAAATREAFDALPFSDGEPVTVGELSAPSPSVEGGLRPRRNQGLGKALFGLGVVSLGLAVTSALAAVFLDVGGAGPVVPLASIGAGAIAIASLASIRDRRDARRARRRRRRSEADES